jgi:hypothetical protein
MNRIFEGKFGDFAPEYNLEHPIQIKISIGKKRVQGFGEGKNTVGQQLTDQFQVGAHMIRLVHVCVDGKAVLINCPFELLK